MHGPIRICTEGLLSTLLRGIYGDNLVSQKSLSTQTYIPRTHAAFYHFGIRGLFVRWKTVGALNRQPNNISNIWHFILSLPYVRVWGVTLAFNWTFRFTDVSLISKLLIWFVQSGKMFLIPVAIEWCGLVTSKPDLCPRFHKSINEVYMRSVCSLFCPDSNQTTCVKYQTRQPLLLSRPNRFWIHVSRCFKTSCSHLLR